MHGTAAEDARTMMSEQRALEGRNSPGERHYYRCGLCQKCVIDRQQPLRQEHAIKDVRAYEYVMGMNKFTRVKKRNHLETAEKILRAASATPAPTASGSSGSAHTPNERTETSTASSGTAMPPTQFPEGSDEEDTTGLPYLTRDYFLRLAPLSIVSLYVDHLGSRIGGDAGKAKRQETAMQINRFLALAGYVHDDYFLSAGHSPGTLRSALLAIRPFLRWLKDAGHASHHLADAAKAKSDKDQSPLKAKVKADSQQNIAKLAADYGLGTHNNIHGAMAERMIPGCDIATRNQVRKREVMLCVEEGTNIPLDPELPQHFYESPWVQQTIKEFEACPAAAYKDIRGLLIAMIKKYSIM
ncbi:hypothetical protein DPMN_090946 [Dreissena polymorpha]|uniref:Uncharacterized protein n=1 Tax=Dreissena polymorpha TaxID=45954 RepID=A0A9D4KZJ9_DREPO|nr:hypothetical protein DPMN_090946 [Dreissena polymorpha]